MLDAHNTSKEIAEGAPEIAVFGIGAADRSSRKAARSTGSTRNLGRRLAFVATSTAGSSPVRIHISTFSQLTAKRLAICGC